MPKKAAELGALAVSRLKAPGRHAVGGVDGLAMQVTPSGARSWVLRVTIGDDRCEMGLGGYPGTSLAQAREAARHARATVRSGLNPIDEARSARSRLKAEQAKAVTFEQAAEKYIDAHEAAWRNAKHAQQWRNTLATHTFPTLGELLVRDVELAHVLKVLEPIWRTKTETASRVRGRIENVLDWAKAHGLRDGDNPARWKGHLDKLLPAPVKVAKVEHHEALPAIELGAFMRDLREADGIGARALEFAILTAARSGEVRGATWREIDIDAAVWTVPANRMKAGKEHRVPLSKAALHVLVKLPRVDGVEHVFPSSRGTSLSDMRLSEVLRRMKVPAVPHGFRSTFRDWAGEYTNYPRELAEVALAHAVGDKTEQAYARGDLFEKRRRLMNSWAAFCATVATKAPVVPMRRKVK